jgi:hypothetical protein
MNEIRSQSMKKLSLSLIAASLLAGGAGLAQAETLALQNGSTLSGHHVVATTASSGTDTYWIDTPVLVGPVIPGAMPVATIDNTPRATFAVVGSRTVHAAASSSDTRVLGAGPAVRPMETVVLTPDLYTMEIRGY